MLATLAGDRQIAGLRRNGDLAIPFERCPMSQETKFPQRAPDLLHLRFIERYHGRGDRR